MAFVSLSDGPAFYLPRWIFESFLEDAVLAAGQERAITDKFETAIDVSGLSLELSPEIADQCISILRSIIEKSLADGSSLLAAKHLKDADQMFYCSVLKKLLEFLDTARGEI